MSSRQQQPLGQPKLAIPAIANLVSHRLNHQFQLGRQFISLFLAGALISVTMAACALPHNNDLTGSPKPDVQITLVSFAVTKQAQKNIIPQFVEKWQKEHNQKVIISQSYGGSGSQTRAVIDGLEADIVHLALAADTFKLERAGLIDPGWQKEFPNLSIVTKSVPAITVRAANPKNIKTWSDLEREGISLITADPKTSGVARWNFLALWNGAFKANQQDQAKAIESLIKVFANVPILARDAREASDAFFKQGQGDVLVNYENEVILAAQKGEKVDYVIPEVNFSIENPIAIVDKNVAKHGTKEVAEAFVKFLYSMEAQAEFAKVGFRPVNEAVAQEKQFVELYPVVKDLASVEDYGGWEEIEQKFFTTGGIFDQIQAKINR